MVTKGARDDESNSIINRPIRADDVEVGRTVSVSGKTFLPESDLEIVDVTDCPDDERAKIRFTARIPNRSNARDYAFRISEYGIVKTTNAKGIFGPTVEAVIEVEADTPVCSLCGSEHDRHTDLSPTPTANVPPKCRQENQYVAESDKAPVGTVWVCVSCREWIEAADE